MAIKKKKVQVTSTTTVKRRRKRKGETVGRVKKSTTTRSDGTKTVTKTNKRGTTTRTKAYGAGKSKPKKVTVNKKETGMRYASKKEKTYKKGVKGATIKKTSRPGEFGKESSYTTTRKQRIKRTKKAIGKGVKNTLKAAAVGAALSNPVGSSLLKGAGMATVGLLGAGGVRYAKNTAKDIGRRAKNVGKKVKKVISKKVNKIKAKRKSPNRKRL
tara:strand:- start:3716 stop:4357 length:642 start_codon:yes stop_codon:yes gene_type:complete